MSVNDRILYILILSIIGIIQSVIAVNVGKKNKFSPAYNGFNFGVLIYYIIVPIYVLLNLQSFIDYENACNGMFCVNSVNRILANNTSADFYLYFFAVLVCIIIFNFFYHITKRSNKVKKEISIDKKISIVKKIMYFCLFLGTGCLLLFFSKFGGISAALSYADYLRSFNTDTADIVGGFNILIIPARLVTVVPFLIVYLKTYENKKKYNVIFIISLFLSATFYLYNAGRAPIICFILCFVYMILKNKVKHVWVILIFCAVIGLPLLDVFDSLFFYFNSGVFEPIDINYIKYIQQFLAPLGNILNMSHITNQFGYRYFTDFVTSILDLMPGITFEPSYANTSLYISGPNWQVLGGTPNDFITFCFLQFNLLGVMILSAIIGVITKKIDLNLGKWKKSRVKNLFSGALSIFIFIFIPSADFVALIRGSMILLVISLIIILLGGQKENENTIRDINTN